MAVVLLAALAAVGGATLRALQQVTASMDTVRTSLPVPP